MKVRGVFVGSITSLPPDGTPSGIFKHAVAGPLAVSVEGLAGDRQADRRVHGGAEKAVHGYPAEHYRRLAAAFPALADLFVAGSMGENLSVGGWDEESVCIGDVFRVGSCRLQVSQPRSPCWKINHKFGDDGLAQFITQEGITGWYFRVLETGTVAVGDACELLERNPAPVSLARLGRVQREHRPEGAELREIAATPGLTPALAKKLLDRLGWLERLRGPAA